MLSSRKAFYILPIPLVKNATLISSRFGRSLNAFVSLNRPIIQKRSFILGYAIGLGQGMALSDNEPDSDKIINNYLSLKRDQEVFVMEYIQKLQTTEYKQQLFDILMQKQIQIGNKKNRRRFVSDDTSDCNKIKALEKAKYQMIINGLWEKNIELNDLPLENQYGVECIQKLWNSEIQQKLYDEFTKDQASKLEVENKNWLKNEDLIKQYTNNINILHDIKFSLIKQNKWS